MPAERLVSSTEQPSGAITVRDADGTATGDTLPDTLRVAARDDERIINIAGGFLRSRSVGSLMVGAGEGLGGKLIRTVSFLGWTLPVSFFGGTAPLGMLGIFSAIT